MPKMLYTRKKFNAETQIVIDRSLTIVDRYIAQGLRLTLRQLFYQHVAGDTFPDSWADPKAGNSKNTQKNYKRLGSIVNDARLAGLMDWDAIEDRTRELNALSTWASPNEIVRAISQQFRFDLWKTQPYYPEVWVEKEALAGVIEAACRPLRVNFLACRGYTSQSEMWGSSQRFIEASNRGQKCIVFHFGDHDPSGIDMSRDIKDRLGIFRARVKIKRIALNMDQVEQYNPPPNPAKTTDARFRSYQQEYGDESWELDALEPTVLRSLITNEIMGIRDAEIWGNRLAEEDAVKRQLRGASRHWGELVEHMEQTFDLAHEDELAAQEAREEAEDEQQARDAEGDDEDDSEGDDDET